MTAEPVHLVDGAVSIDGRPVVRGVDLVVGVGDFVTIMGPNGSGKSTLMRGLTGLLPLAHGTLHLFGTEFSSFSEWFRIGYVPQHAAMSGGVPATVREVVTAGRLTRRRLLRPLSRTDKDAIDDALGVVGLSGLVNRSVYHLSGGQRQRVLIARALAGQPDLLFLDEPTAGVDLPNQINLADTLATLKARGTTIVMVAHELGPIAPLVDRAVVLRDGRVNYDGPALSQDQAHAHLDRIVGDVHAYERPFQIPPVASPLDTLGDDA
ncbi:MAG: metal ABC transporter ATP-binding protein [Nocardioides sp.]|uniref:metal ABC transporter ATP-binding protein n=1 Tax=Nocardioides sp. TaxID=35761 RepID=UPI003F10E49F